MNLSEKLDKVLGLVESHRQALSFHQRSKLHPPNEVPVKEAGQSTKGPGQSTKEPTYGAYRGSEDSKDKRKKPTKQRTEPEFD